MKIDCIELENWRKHNKKRVVFDEKTNIIYGPNESGKSTIFEGLSRGFFDKSSSNAGAIKRIMPLYASGRISSTVKIEFLHNNRKFRVEKNFNLRQGTKLFEIASGDEKLLAQDVSADEKLIELLEAELPSTGASKPSKWGAFHWLWAPQDNREIPTNKDGDPTISLNLETERGEGLLVTPKFQYTKSIVNANYLKYYTRTGRYSGSSSILDIQKEIEDIEQEYFDARSKIDSVEDNKQKLEDLQKSLPGLKETYEKTKKELEKARSESVDFSSIVSKLEASEIRVKEANRDVENAESAIQDIKDASKTIEDLQKKVRNTEVEVPKIEALSLQNEQRLKDKKKEANELAMKIRDTEELTKDARILYTIDETSKKIKEYDKKIERVKKLDKEIKQLLEKEIAIVPSEEDINKIVEQQIRMEVLRRNLISKGLNVNIKKGDKGSLDVIVDGDKLAEEVDFATGAESVTVKAKGFGEVIVQGKLDKAKDAKADIIDSEKKIKDVLSKFDVDSLDNLKQLNKSQSGIKSKIKELNAERKGVDETSLDEIKNELQKLEEKKVRYEKNKRSEKVIKLNPIDSNLSELIKKREKEEKGVREKLDEARVERDAIEREYTKKKEKLIELKTKMKIYSDDLERAKKNERDVVKKYGSEENQVKILIKSKEKLRLCQDEYKKNKEKYEELEKGPINKMKRLNQQIENQEKIIQQKQTLIDQFKGSIATASIDGAYSELANMESKLEIFKERNEKEMIKSEAIKLLKEVLEEQYHSALSTVIGPIQEDVKRYLAYATGNFHENVVLNEYLFPIKLGEKGLEDISLEFEDSSSGLKEVLGLCIRLSVAKHLSKKDVQCLVLDDPFIHVSEDRSNRIIEIINELIEHQKLQVIIFTHRPMEFAGLSGKMIDIQAS